jgi:hypothetical protein
VGQCVVLGFLSQAAENFEKTFGRSVDNIVLVGDDDALAHLHQLDQHEHSAHVELGTGAGFVVPDMDLIGLEYLAKISPADIPAAGRVVLRRVPCRPVNFVALEFQLPDIRPYPVFGFRVGIPDRTDKKNFFQAIFLFSMRFQKCIRTELSRQVKPRGTF